MCEPDGERAERTSPRKKREVIHKEHRKTRAQTPAFLKSMPLPSVSETNIFDKYYLHEKLKAVLL